MSVAIVEVSGDGEIRLNPAPGRYSAEVRDDGTIIVRLGGAVRADEVPRAVQAVEEPARDWQPSQDGRVTVLERHCPDDCMTRMEAAEALGIREVSVSSLIKRGQLEGRRIGR